MARLISDPASLLEEAAGGRLAVDANVIVIGGAGLLEQLYGAAEYVAAKAAAGGAGQRRTPSIRDAVLRRVLARDDAGAALVACSREFGAKCLTTEAVLVEARALYNSTPYTALFAAFKPGGRAAPADVNLAIDAIISVLGRRSMYKAARMMSQVRSELARIMPVIAVDRVNVWELTTRGDPAMLRVLAAANSVLGDPNCARQQARSPSPHPPLSREDLGLLYLAYVNNAILATGDRQMARVYLALEGKTYYIYIDGLALAGQGRRAAGRRGCDPAPRAAATYCTRDGVQRDVYLPEAFTPDCSAAAHL